MRLLRGALSDRHRLPVALAVVVFLVATSLYWVWMVVTLQVGDWHAIQHPRAHPGEEIVLSLWDVTSVDGPGAYHLGKSGHEVAVAGPTAGLAVGDSLSVGVEIGPAGDFTQQWLEPHPARPAKKWAGIVSLAFLALFLPLAFRVRGGRVVPRG